MLRMDSHPVHRVLHPLLVLGAALLLWGALLALTSYPAQAVSSSRCSAADGTTTCAFDPTGAEDTFKVPAGVSSVRVVATGAPGSLGGDYSGPAGRGARVSGDLTVTPGQTLYVEVGGAAIDGYGGFNGGGSSTYGGGGGGASDVRTKSRVEDGSLGSRLIVAGGGGGSGVTSGCRGGTGGFPSGGSGGDAGSDGGNGASCYSTAGGTGGKAGGQSTGGPGGDPYGQSGSLGLGGEALAITGDGVDYDSYGGGGGGGGYYGGGSGGNWVIKSIPAEDTADWAAAGGGGGGSNLVPAGGTAAIATGDPAITISYATPKNQAPAAADDPATTNEDTATNIDVLSNDTDVDNDALSVSGFTQPSHGTVSENADGTLAYAPAKDFNGSDSFTYTANDGTVDSNEATVNITVGAVNDAPGFTKGADQTVNEDAATQTVTGFATNISPGPSNESTQKVSFDATNDKYSLFTATGQPAISSDGTLTYTPAKDANGNATVTVKATDDGGTQDGGVNASAAQTFKITVNPVNDNPVANPDTIDVVEDTPTDLDVLANDTDVDGDSLGISNVVASKLTGDFDFKDGQHIFYIPPPNFTGRESLDYTVVDGNGGFDQASVTINVTPVNDAPTAKDGSYTTNEDTPTNMVLGASDVDGDAPTYGIVGGPAHGKLTGSGADRTYTPDPDYNGPDSFTFKASDGTADSNVATVSISVKAVNDAPTVTVLAGGASQSACLGDTTGRLTLKLSDVDSNFGDLKPSVASSSDTRLVPKSNVIFGGSGGTRTATISTVPGRTGTSTVMITVGDGQASSSVPVTVRAGGNGKDTLGGTSGADLLLGQNGDDTLSGLGASDVLCGANGDDKLGGGTGSDTFDGGPGADTATDYNAAEGDARTNIP